MRILIHLYFLIIPFGLFAQKTISFNRNSFDWGDMISTQFPPVAFIFTNKGTKPLAIISTTSAFEIKVSYERRYVAPGDSGIIYVKHESNKTGAFEHDIEVLFNTESKPVKLSVKGNNVSVISCHPDPKNYRNREIRVIDAITKDPVPHASCSFFSYNHDKPFEFACDIKGKKRIDLPIGMYDISIQSPGYLTYKASTMIPKTAPIIYYELERNPFFSRPKPPEPVAATPTIKQKTVPKDTIKTPPPKTTANNEVLPVDKFKPNNIVFLLDISNSMNANGKFTALKTSIRTLVDALRPIDTVTIITYNIKAELVLEAVSGGEKQKILNQINNLRAFGLTDGVAGLELAYANASKHLNKNGNNQLIVATDGEFVGGQMTDDKMRSLVEENSLHGIIISIVCFGQDREAIDKLHKLAELGHGSSIQISSNENATGILLDEIKQRSKTDSR